MISQTGGRQTFDFDCGAKASQLVLTYFGLDTRADELMTELKCSSVGCPIKSMISLAEKYGFEVVA